MGSKVFSHEQDPLNTGETLSVVLARCSVEGKTAIEWYDCNCHRRRSDRVVGFDMVTVQAAMHGVDEDQRHNPCSIRWPSEIWRRGDLCASVDNKIASIRFDRIHGGERNVRSNG